jgi:hypothetical protein
MMFEVVLVVKIRFVATLLRIILLTIMGLLPVMHFILWLCVDPLQAATSNTVALFWPTKESLALNWQLSLIGASIDSINVVFEMLICYFLAKLFKLYASGQIFTKLNVACFYQLGLVILFGKIASYIEQPLLSYSLTWLKNPLAAEYTIGFKTTDLSVILFAIFLIIISWIMGEAVKLNEEHELTI